MSGTRAFSHRLRLKKQDVESGRGIYIEGTQSVTIIPVIVSFQSLHRPHRLFVADRYASGGDRV
jgi:hypothetical protein